GGRSGVQDVGQQPAEPGRTRREFEAAVTEDDDRDRRKVGSLPVRVGLDVALDEHRVRAPGRGTFREHGCERVPRVVAQVAPRAAVQKEVGEGSVVHLATDCRGGSRKASLTPGYDGVRAPVAQWTERGRPKACVGGSSPSGGAIATQRARSCWTGRSRGELRPGAGRAAQDRRPQRRDEPILRLPTTLVTP